MRNPSKIQIKNRDITKINRTDFTLDSVQKSKMFEKLSSSLTRARREGTKRRDLRFCESIVGVKACLIEKAGSPAYKDSLS